MHARDILLPTAAVAALCTLVASAVLAAPAEPTTTKSPMKQPRGAAEGPEEPAGASDGEPAAAAEAKAGAADPAEAARRALPVASYQGGEITVGELEDHIAAQNPFMRKRYQDPGVLQDLVRKLARFELLAQEAERRGFGNTEAVKHAVKQNAVQAYLRGEFDEGSALQKVPAEDVAKYYDEHLAEFVQPAMRRASHVVLASEDEAKALIKTAKEMDLRAFRQTAKDRSIDELTKLRGGDLRFFKADGAPHDAREGDSSVEPAIAEAAFSLKEVGDTYGKPVKVGNGFSVLKLSGIRPASEQTLQDADLVIRRRLARERRQRAIDDRIAKLKEELKPQVHAELISQIKFDDVAPVAKGKKLPDGFPAAPAPPTE